MKNIKMSLYTDEELYWAIHQHEQKSKRKQTKTAVK